MFSDILSEDAPNTLGAYISFANGKKRPQSIGTIPVYGGNGILTYSAESNANNCVIIGRVGAYCGSTFLCQESCWVSDNAIQAKSKKEASQVFIYYLLKNASLPSRHAGSGQPLMTQEALNSIRFTAPESNLVVQFTEIVDPMHRLISFYEQHTRELLNIRNWLLPLLMSGQATIAD